MDCNIMSCDDKKGLVSIGLPTYNRPDSLRRVLDIITAQTYSNLEIIVSEDASPDTRVREVVEEFSSRDSRIKYYRQDQNKGVLANAEFVLKKSQGEYFTWFSDDDWRSPEFIEILVAELENNKDVDLAFCDYYEVYEDGRRAVGYPKTHLGVFKPFKSRFRLVRTMCFYWQNHVRGNGNLFYSVFRKAVLDALDLKKISGGYQHLNMDCLIVFSLLQDGPVSISSEIMCTLTCKNKKYYTGDECQAGPNNKSVLSKLVDFWVDNKKDRDLYVSNTNLFIEKVIIHVSFVPRFVLMLATIILKKTLGKKSHDGVNCSDEPDKLQNYTSGNVNHNDNRRIKLPNVTLISMDTRDVEKALQAIHYSCIGVEFGSVKLLSHYTLNGIDESVEFVKIDKIHGIDEWCYKVIYDLHKYVDTDFILLVHADGFVVNPMSWRDEFLDYDYIGAPWPLPSDDFSYRDIHGNIIRVGNSVSLRSKRLLELPSKLNLPWEPYHDFYHEDGFLCAQYRHILKAKGINYAPLDVAKYFSHETMIPEVRNIKPFAFHKWAGSNHIYPKF